MAHSRAVLHLISCATQSDRDRLRSCRSLGNAAGCSPLLVMDGPRSLRGDVCARQSVSETDVRRTSLIHQVPLRFEEAGCILRCGRCASPGCLGRLRWSWRQREPEIILCAVRWYLRYSLSLRDVEELLIERRLGADHTTVWRWVQRYAPNWNSECDGISSRLTNRGGSMRPI